MLSRGHDCVSGALKETEGMGRKEEGGKKEGGGDLETDFRAIETSETR